MIKICNESVTIPLKIISEESLKKELSQTYGKKEILYQHIKRRHNFNK